MPADSRLRPLTGEILDHGGAMPRGQTYAPGGSEIADADYETVAVSRTPKQVASSSIAQETGAGPGEVQPDFRNDPAADATGMGMLRAAGDKTSARRYFTSQGGPTFWGLAVVLVASAFWISGGHSLVSRLADQRGEPDFAISNVASVMESRDGHQTLRVDTMVENRSGRDLSLPPVLIAIHGSDGLVSHYKLGTSRALLKPGASHLFSGNLEAPKVGVARVSVRLGSREDG